jgi:hypothetical protein
MEKLADSAISLIFLHVTLQSKHIEYEVSGINPDINIMSAISLDVEVERIGATFRGHLSGCMSTLANCQKNRTETIQYK